MSDLPTLLNQKKAYEFLQAEAAKRGKTYQEFLATDIRPMLEKAYEIQQRTGKPVKIEDLVEAMNQK